MAKSLDTNFTQPSLLLVPESSQWKSLQEELLLIREALDDCGSSVVIVDPALAITYLNASFGMLFGCTRSDMRAVAFLDLFADRELGRTMLEGVLEGGRWQGEVTMIASGGRKFPASLRATPVLNDAYDVSGALIIFNDITERKQLEAQLVQAQNLKAVGQLAAGIAHEINTPMQYIGDNARFLQESFSDLLATLAVYEDCLRNASDGRLDPVKVREVKEQAERADVEYLAGELPAAVEESLEGIARVTEIVRAMRQFTHPGGGEKKALDINEAIKSTATVARNEWRYAAEIEYRLEEDLPPVLCFVADFNQVILNLVVNAAQAIAEKLGRNLKDKGEMNGLDEKGRITITTANRGPEVEVRIADTGNGIPEDVQDRIFEPFFTTKEVGEGTGQGLAISHAALEKQGGTLTFETEEGVGTTFIVRMPFT